ncbi:hypothetical protein KC131_23960 [Pseudomonas sp. JQ170]|uniref:hypothetical protein n=1 Tax=unclassified Pseudomonas TaxID=196821 RepID=UPI0026502823|nr:MULTISPECIES: hypothetical protein [unclassified Pseudomonas]MDN7143710.1 hypothetical protein [Pseudomonas sp. JQ170]WRO74121.1 hypothetical protein U9R80_16475 [Pseudomonas sp. 170C]
MKYLAAFIVALTLGSSAFATECDDSIKQLENIDRTDGQALAGGKVDEFRELLEQAKQAQKAGDEELCNSSAQRALQIYKVGRSK